MTTATTDRERRRTEFRQVFESMPGTMQDRIARVCDILGYRPNTIRVLLCRAQAWKVIPQAKLDILRRELARDAAAQQ